jgi:hypothetical protein
MWCSSKCNRYLWLSFGGATSILILELHGEILGLTFVGHTKGWWCFDTVTLLKTLPEIFSLMLFRVNKS